MEHRVELVGEVGQHAADVVQNVAGTSLNSRRPGMMTKVKIPAKYRLGRLPTGLYSVFP